MLPTLNRLTNMTILEIAANITTGYDRNSFVWIVQLYGFDLNESNNFYFILALEGSEGNGVYNSSFFNITNQSSPATATPTLGSTATSASVVTLTSSPSSAPLTGLSRETLGIALGIGIPGLIAILVTLFFLLKQKTLPDENPTPTQCTPRRVWPRQQIFEVANDFTYGAELSGDRNSRYFAELPITG